jgi:integrase
MLGQGASVDSVNQYIKSVVAEFVKPKKAGSPKAVSIKKKGITFVEASGKAWEKHFKNLDQPMHYKTHLKNLNEVAQSVLKTDTVYLSDLTAPVISDVRGALAETRGLTTNTCNRYMATLRKLFHIMKNELRVVSEVPYIKFSPETKGRIFTISEDLEQKVVGYLTVHAKDVHLYPEVADLFVFLLNSGFRINEALSLHYASDVDFKNEVVVLSDPSVIKNEEPRVVPFTRKSKEILLRRRKLNGLKPFPFNIYTLEKKMAQIRMEMCITNPQFCFHACRHTYASRLIERGAEAFDVKTLMGHKAFVTTEKYIHMNKQKLKRATRLLDAVGE